MSDKTFSTLVTTFCVGFGLITCNLSDFACGLFAGMLVVATVDIWFEDSESA